MDTNTATTNNPNTQRFQYPAAERIECNDNPGKVLDAYRWMEDTNHANLPDWISKQNQLTESFLAQSNVKKLFQDEVTKLYNYQKFSAPFKRADRYYFFKNNGLQNQSVMYYQNSLEDEPKVFFDPNELSSDGTVALSTYDISEDGKLFAYGLSRSGSDWITIYVQSTAVDNLPINRHHPKEDHAADKKDNKKGEKKEEQKDSKSTITQPESEPKASEPKLSEPKPSEPKPSEPKPSEHKLSEPKPSEPKASETEVEVVDVLRWVKFSSLSWTKDNKGFFYCRYAEQTENKNLGTETKANTNQKLYYHKVGQTQSNDREIIGGEKAEWMYGCESSDDGKWGIITVHESTAPLNRVYLIPNLDKKDPASGEDLGIVRLIDNWEAEYSFISNDGNTLYFRTNLNAPRNKLISINLDSLLPILKKGKRKLSVEDSEEEKAADKSIYSRVCAEMKDLIAEPPSNSVLSSVYRVNHKYFVVASTVDVNDTLDLYDTTGKFIKSLDIGVGNILVDFTGREQDTGFFYKITSFLTPAKIYYYDLENMSKKLFREITVEGFNADSLQTQQVFYTSKDGTKVPMYIFSKKGVELNGNNGVLLYGYGGFNISMQPYFSVFYFLFVSMFNGIVAIPNIRGGGEYGEEWHAAGTLARKQNVFDDFHAAAEYLIQHKYTQPNKIGIVGGSNGGLLVGACLNQRPDLYGCGIAQVGVMDMLRFHKFTIGYAWCSDYGCADNPTDFEYLIKYSPLHNIKKGKPYPAVLITTADHDDRVVPLHSYKYIAELQYQLGKEPYQVNPLLIKIDTKAGHGAGTPTTKIISEGADRYAFLIMTLGMTPNKQ